MILKYKRIQKDGDTCSNNNKKEERQDDAVYKNLANAIIKRAADDYVDAQIQIHKNHE